MPNAELQRKISAAKGKVDDLIHRNPLNVNLFGQKVEVYPIKGTEIGGIKVTLGNITSGIIGSKETVLHLHDENGQLKARVKLGKAHPDEQLSKGEIKEILESADIADSTDGKMVDRSGQEICIINFRTLKGRLVTKAI